MGTAPGSLELLMRPPPALSFLNSVLGAPAPLSLSRFTPSLLLFLLSSPPSLSLYQLSSNPFNL